MSIAYLRQAGIAFLAFVVVAAVILIFPTARLGAHSSGVLDACINPGNGMMRLVDANAACHANETRVEWNITGPAGPAGPPGPPGSSSGGPPFVWVCTPANYFQGGNTEADIFIFNGSATTANVASHFLNKDGTNLAGVTVPASNPPTTYPGQTGNTTVAVSTQNTLIVHYQTATGNPADGGDVLATITVTSDQPIAVGSNIQFSGFHPVPCSLLPK